MTPDVFHSEQLMYGYLLVHKLSLTEIYCKCAKINLHHKFQLINV
jgi:hypothetical protein